MKIQQKLMYCKMFLGAVYLFWIDRNMDGNIMSNIGIKIDVLDIF